MAKRKRRRRSQGPGPGRGNGSAPPQPSARPAERQAVRREHKEEARRRRDAAVRRMRMRQAARRAVTALVLAGVVVGGILFFTNRAREDEQVSAQAQRAAEAAGCTEARTVADPRAPEHIAPGEPITWQSRPATSGPHRDAPLPPDDRVYTEQPDEGQAVHNLEHGYVIMWHRGEGNAALPGGVVDRLTAIAEGEAEVILAPYAELPAGDALALVAWNRLQVCPASVTADQAATIARAFIARFRNGPEAPEPAVP